MPSQTEHPRTALPPRAGLRCSTRAPAVPRMPSAVPVNPWAGTATSLSIRAHRHHPEATTMSQTLTTFGPDWPCQVKTPGTRDWERTAARWLRDLLPARYAGYSMLTRHPVLLARHAQLQVQHEIRAVRVALQTSRAELPTLGVAETIIENTIRMYAVELEQLNRLARGVRLVNEALLSDGAGSAPPRRRSPAQRVS